MRNLIYYVASSADHFIAEKDGGIDWLEDDKWKIIYLVDTRRREGCEK